MSGLRKAGGIIGIVCSAFMQLTLIFFVIQMIMSPNPIIIYSWVIALIIAILALVGGILALVGKGAGGVLMLIAGIIGVTIGIMALVLLPGDMLQQILTNVSLFSLFRFLPLIDITLLGAAIECYALVAAGILALIGRD